MSKFKAGDLALLIKANNSENIGQVVELIRFDDAEHIFHAPEGDGHTLNLERDPCFVSRGRFVVSDERGRIHKTEVAAIPVAWLMPLRGDFQPEQQKSREVPA